jgi:hypothetical protein
VDALKQASFNSVFNLQLAEKILLKTEGSQLLVELRSLNDDRCSSGSCEHEGSATARIFISDTDHAQAETNLCIGMCDTQRKNMDSVDVTLNGIKYTMILNKVYGSEKPTAQFVIRVD